MTDSEHGPQPRYPLHSGAQMLQDFPAQVARIKEGGARGPASGSPAENELEAFDDFRREMLLQVRTLSILRLAAAEEHLRLVGQAIAGPQTIYPVYSAARTVAELSARAWWLLDPTIDADKRAARMLAERFYSFQELAQLPSGLANAFAQKRVGEYVRNARSSNMHVTRSKKGRVSAAQSVPSATSLLENIYENDTGIVSYKLLSAFTHGTAYALETLLEETSAENELEGTRLGVVTTEASKEATVAIMALLPYREALARQVAYYGWDDGRDMLTQAIYIATEFQRHIQQ